MRMRIIVRQCKILIPESEDVGHLRINCHFRKPVWFPGKLKLHLLNMIKVDVGIAQGMNKFPRLQSCCLCNHQCKQVHMMQY